MGVQEIPARTGGGGPLPEPAAFRAVVDSIPHMVWIASPDGQAEHFNVAAAAYMGAPAEAATGWNWLEIIHPDDLERTRQAIGDALTGARHFEIEYRLLNARSEFRWVVARGLPVLDEAGDVTCWLGTWQELGGERVASVSSDDRDWVRRLERAIAEDRLTLFSQPIVPLGAGLPREELLLRMEEDGRIVAPGCFLPAAERDGYIVEVDRWVIGRAARLAAAGRRIDVNLSAASLGRAGLLAGIEHELSSAGADPGLVTFELTETALMADIDAGERFAQGLRSIGCGLALDDFGTGFGSFTYLKRLPITHLKIDIDFVRELRANDANRHLVKAIVGLAADFGYETIAEGVEDAETLRLLGELGVDHAQGYHLGRPAPLA